METGDIGPKLGFIRIDNGYLSFKKVEVPRRAMLMKYVTVSADGVVNGLENKQAIKYGYGSMLNLRVILVYNFAMAFILTPTINQY